MSILRSKHSGWTHNLERHCHKGGGGGGAPSQTTTVNTNIPEYARPYVENMLGAAQEQLFTTQDGEISGFRPYVPYSSDPTNYFAGPSGLQTQAYNQAAAMQSPGQFNLATGLAGLAGQGSLGAQGQAGQLAGQALGYGQAASMYGGTGAQQALRGAEQAQRQASMYGLQGAGFGQQAAGLGQQFAQQATDPNAVGAYMSPYTQNVIDVQKDAAIRDYQKAMPGLAAQAVRQGAFGGSRSAIERAEAGRTLGSNLMNIQATGQQKAYEDAMRNMQYGSTLGLQGLQAGMQGAGVGLSGVGQQLAGGQLGLQGTAQGIQGAQAGLQGVQGAIGAGQYGLQGLGQATQAASTLGQLGATQQATDINAINLQNQLGGQQQQYQQNIINQAIQDYATQQQYPLMQLSNMSNLLRGLPMQASTTQQYQAQPSGAQQALGLGLGALGAYKAFS
jgi:hypothetical protein